MATCPLPGRRIFGLVARSWSPKRSFVRRTSDSGMIYGFREVGGHFELAATTGTEFDGYSLFTREMRSPVPGVFWLFAGGRAHTFNGSRFRFRLYEYDGNAFRVSWSPDDVFGATVQITPEGLTLTHEIRTPPYTITDEYTSTLSGLVRVR